ncbi:MAG: hypothetical protein RR107_02450 [Clostridia bacterium]
MNNFLLIYKTIFKQKFRRDKGAKRSKSFKTGMIFTFGLLAVIYLPLLGMQLFAMADAAARGGFGKQYLSMVYTMLQGISLFFGTILLMNTLFNSRENEFFATLPVKPQTIFFAKLAYVVTNELVLAGTIGTIAIVIYGVVAQMNFSFYILGLISVILTPLLALLASSILLFPISYIMSFLKKSSTFSSIVSIGAFLIFMVLYMGFFGKFMNTMTDPAQLSSMIESIGNALFFNVSMANIVFLGEGFATDLLIVAGLYIGGILLTYVLSSLIYKRSLKMQSEIAHAKIKKMGYQSTSLIKSLMVRDWKCIKRDTSMLFQCGMMVIMPALMILLLFGVMYKGMGIEGEKSSILLDTMGVFFLVMFTCGSNTTATSSISRENRNFYIMKIIPVPYEIQIKAKVLLAFTLGAIGSITGGIACVILGMNVFKAIVLVLTCLILSYGFTCIQVKFDLDKPKLNWENFNEAIKNSRTAMVSMFIGMGFAVVVMLILMLPTMLNGVLPELLLTIISYATVLIISIICAFFASHGLNKNINMYFEKIES